MKKLSLEKKIKITLRKSRKSKAKNRKEIKKITRWKYEATKVAYEEFKHVWFSKFKYKGKQTKRLTYGFSWFFCYKKRCKTVYFFKDKYLNTVNENTIKECKNVVIAYNNQLSLRQTQALLYQKLEDECTKIKRRLEIHKENKLKIKKLKQHGRRLIKMDNIDGLRKPYENIGGTEGLQNIIDDYELKEEIYTQINKLAVEYGDDISYENTVVFKDEIEEMIKFLD